MEGFRVVTTSTTASSAQATVANTDGIAIGSYVIGTGIAPGTTVLSIDGPTTYTITMSTNSITANVSNNPITINGTINVIANTTSNNPQFTVPSSTAGLALGQSVTGTNIPAGTTIVQISPSLSNFVTLSAPATLTNSNQAFTYGANVKQVNTTLNASTVTVTSATGLSVGQVVLLSGNAPLTYITAINTSVNPNVISLSNPNTSTSASNVNMQFAPWASEMQLASLSDVSAAPTGVPAGANALCQLGLMDRLNMQLMGGQMPASMNTLIATYVNGLLLGSNTSYTNNLARARAAVYLVLSSANYSVVK